MREHPLLMQGPLVRATLAGRKTQTRRPVQPWLGRNPPLWSRLIDQDGKPDFDWGELLYYGQDEDSLRHGFGFDDSGHGCPENDAWLTSPIGGVGDRLWVRETWARPGDEEIIYRADKWAADLVAKWKEDPNCPQVKWTPSIHMPRRACRLVLPLVSVRVERVQDITEEDANAEGVPHNSNRPIDKMWCAACLGHGIVERFALGTMSTDDCSECDTAKKLFRNIWVHLYGQESWDANPWVWVAEWKEIEVSK